MNILHHKSWHVRTKQNIERVRRDEENAANEEKEKLRKIALAEQEARTELLRNKAKARLCDVESRGEDRAVEGQGQSSAVVESESHSGHINFFQEIEDGLKTHGKNVEHEQEKAAEKEKWEKSIGLLTYLGQSAAESQESSPWYLESQSQKKKKEEEKEDIFDLKTMKERKRQAMLDPLNNMKEFVHKKKHKHHKEKKDKHKSKHREKESHKEKKSGGKSMDQLRAERVRREADEKRKSEALLSRLRGDEPTQPEEPTDDRKRKYNSQYNPECVRQPKKPRQTYGQDFNTRH